MTERRIEDAPLPVRFRPPEREVAVGPVELGGRRHLRHVEPQSTRILSRENGYATSCLAPMGRLDDALDELLVAQSLDPVSSIVARDVAVIHTYERDFDAALDQCDHTIR
jgi:hypothetical protein